MANVASLGAISLAITASIIWGAVYALNGKLMDKMSPMTLMWIVTGCEFLILTTWFAVSGKPGYVPNLSNKADMSLLFIIILFTFAANALIYLSIAYLNASLAAMIEISYPIFTLAAAWLLFRELQAGPWAIAGTVLVIIGVVLITHDALRQKSKDPSTASASIHGDNKG